MYSYLQVSSLNFKLLRFVNSDSPMFPFEVLCSSYSADLPPLFIFSLFFHQLSVTPKCSLALHTLVFFFELTTLNLSQPSYLIHAASARHISTQLASVEFV